MEIFCYAKKKNGDLCNTRLTEKNTNEIKIKDKTYLVCGRHKKINNEKDIEVNTDNTNIKNKNKENKIYTEEERNSSIVNEFNEKISITSDETSRSKDKKNKKPCLQYIIYLISKDDDDACKFEDCQFAHNIEIVYTD